MLAGKRRKKVNRRIPISKAIKLKHQRFSYQIVRHVSLEFFALTSHRHKQVVEVKYINRCNAMMKIIATTTLLYTHSYEVDPALWVGIRQLYSYTEHTEIRSRQDGYLPPVVTHTGLHSLCNFDCSLVTYTPYRMDMQHTHIGDS